MGPEVIHPVQGLAVMSAPWPARRWQADVVCERNEEAMDVELLLVLGEVP